VVDIGYAPSTSGEDALSALLSCPERSAAPAKVLRLLEAGKATILSRLEHGPNEQVRSIVMLPYQVFLQRKIDNTFWGKLRTTGGARRIFTRSGGTGSYHCAGTADSLARNGRWMAFPTASTVMTWQVVKASLEREFRSAVLTYMISNARWKTLPPAVQKAMSEAGEKTVRRICAYADNEVGNDFAKIRAKGVAVAPLPAEDKPALAALARGVSQEWAERLDKRGKAGNDVLRSFMEALK
jgi:hypothetical protein